MMKPVRRSSSPCSAVTAATASNHRCRSSSYSNSYWFFQKKSNCTPIKNSTLPFLFLLMVVLLIDNSLLPTAAAAESSSSAINNNNNNNNNKDIKNNEYNITNPYYSGCLQAKIEGWEHRKRVCSERPEIDGINNNNNNDNAKELGLCREAPFDSYMEIRVGVGNWDSATALGWLTQIILSEIMGVPSSIESGMYGSSRDFYDPHAAIDYDRSVRAQALATATDLVDGDCRSLPPATSNDEYEPCAHFMPEMWGNPASNLIDDQKVEPPQTTGVLGLETWFVTKFTAEEFPEFASYHGLKAGTNNNTNRQKVAETFKRPTTWKEYCQEVSINNCTTPDDVAQRAPSLKDEDDEADRMFVENIYTGHFRYTEKNNCTAHPTTCTGHIANYPCGWSSNMEALIYHLDLAMDSHNGGPDKNAPGGYTARQLKEMWHAANATRSHLMMMWWTPEQLYQHFLGTDAEFQRVGLPPFTRECDIAIDEWLETRDECSTNLTERVSTPKVACGFPAEPLRKLINYGLYEDLNNNNAATGDIAEAAKSPAYDMLRRFQISDLILGELFDLIESEPTPRDAVCTWAAKNLEFLYSTVPTTYPRVTKEESYVQVGYIAIVLGSVATLLVVVTSFRVYQKRNNDAIQFAQVDFLTILLVGSFLVGLGSILLSLPASDATCLASIWFINVGYTLELVPLIIKVAAINRVMEAARTMRRVTIKRENLYSAVGVIGACLIIFLSVWSALDPPLQVSEYSLTSATTDNDEHIVSKMYYCSGGESDAWQFAAVAWNAVLLLCASVLAFQTRNVLQKFNESRTLAFLIYSHFVFVVLRISTFLLADNVSGSALDYSRSLLYACDQMATCFIYFFPKLTISDQDWGESELFGSRRISGLVHPPNKSSHLFEQQQQAISSAQLSDRGAIIGNSNSAVNTNSSVSEPLTMIGEENGSIIIPAFKERPPMEQSRATETIQTSLPTVANATLPERMPLPVSGDSTSTGSSYEA